MTVFIFRTGKSRANKRLSANVYVPRQGFVTAMSCNSGRRTGDGDSLVRKVRQTQVIVGASHPDSSPMHENVAVSAATV
jgi:hypothetical protein